MGYVADASLEDLYDETFVERTSQDIAEAVAEEWVDEVEKRTPVAEIPEAYKGNVGAWIKDRRGRRPGTAKGSWYRTDVKKRGPVVYVHVETEDPVMPHVEWDTRPHAIVPKRARMLRYPQGTRFVYRRRVWHPGTQGQHMMRDSGAEMERRWPVIADRIITRAANAENLRRL